jgi:hypothetical protein
VITAERGDASLTRHGIEEYVSDCVILLDHRVIDQVATRRLRIVKYRGTAHGTNEYPFLIAEDGLSVLPDHGAAPRAPGHRRAGLHGIEGLDEMLGGDGIYRGSSVLLSGPRAPARAASRPTSRRRAAGAASAACTSRSRSPPADRPEPALDRTRSAAVDPQGPSPDRRRPSVVRGLERHLAIMNANIREFDPRMVVIDPISNLRDAGTLRDSTAMLLRLIDFLKGRLITGVLTHLNSGGEPLESTDVGVSSIIDTWILPARRRARRSAAALPVRPQVARHRPLEPDRAVPLDRPRRRDGGRDERPRSRDVGRLRSETAAQGREEPAVMTREVVLRPASRAERPAAGEEIWNLRLYVAGQSAKCLAAVRNLNRFCEEHLPGRYRIEVVDLLENPRLARDDQILAIPTLVRRRPEPQRNSWATSRAPSGS